MAVGYHGTDDIEEVFRDGLRVSKAESLGCPFGHLCIAETPEIAAAFGAHVLVVDLDGLDLPEEGFCGGEMRVHHDIPAERLSVFPHAVEGSLDWHADPFYAYPEQQHPTCVRLRKAQAA
jgi:hypothetical protein